MLSRQAIDALSLFSGERAHLQTELRTHQCRKAFKDVNLQITKTAAIERKESGELSALFKFQSDEEGPGKECEKDNPDTAVPSKP